MIRDQLFELEDKEYAAFQAKLTPGIPFESFIGVRVPELRKLAKEYGKALNAKGGPELESETMLFLKELPHKYYDENMLHAAILSEVRDYDLAVRLCDEFLPFVDNWAVCDTMKPKAFKRNKDRLLEQIKIWSASEATYTCRFGMEMLMNHFLDDAFKAEYLEIPAAVRSEEYYVNMMTAWFFATALAKQWDATIPYIKENRLDVWTHNKTIQKARESFRVTAEQKEYLKSLKRS